MCSRRAAPATSSMLEVHKELSNSYREGIDDKLKFIAKQYKIKDLKKCEMTVVGFHKDLSYSYGEGIDEKLTCMAQPYKTKVWKKYKFWIRILDSNFGLKLSLRNGQILDGTG